MTTVAEAPSYHDVRRVVTLAGHEYELRAVACPSDGYDDTGPDVFVSAWRLDDTTRAGRLQLPYGGMWAAIDLLIDLAEAIEEVP